MSCLMMLRPPPHPLAAPPPRAYPPQDLTCDLRFALLACYLLTTPKQHIKYKEKYRQTQT